MFYRYTNFVPLLAGRYLSSNVNITVFNSDGTNESVPVGSKFEFEISFDVVNAFSQTVQSSSPRASKWPCEFDAGRALFICHGRGRRITSLGVLFNFFGNAGNTTVQNVADMVKEQWVLILALLMWSRHGILIVHSLLRLSRKSLTHSYLLGRLILAFLTKSISTWPQAHASFKRQL